jgi:hypothetical protein
MGSRRCTSGHTKGRRCCRDIRRRDNQREPDHLRAPARRRLSVGWPDRFAMHRPPSSRRAG